MAILNLARTAPAHDPTRTVDSEHPGRNGLCLLFHQHYAQGLSGVQRDLLETHLLVCPDCLAWLLDNAAAMAAAMGSLRIASDTGCRRRTLLT